MADEPLLPQQKVAIGARPPSVGSVRPGGRTARTRAGVLAATLNELARTGYDRLTLDTVAAHAGVHKTTVYRRWSTKELLVADALQTLAESRVDIPDTGDFDRDLRLLARSVVDTITTPEGAGTVRAMVSGAQHSEVVRGIVVAFWADRTEQAGLIVRRALDRGELPQGTCPRLVIRHLGAPLYHQLLVTLDPLTTASADFAAAAAAAAAHAGAFIAPVSPPP
jgi:AcrR family transcriptional regulator